MVVIVPEIVRRRLLRESQPENDNYIGEGEWLDEPLDEGHERLPLLPEERRNLDQSIQRLFSGTVEATGWLMPGW